MNDKILYGYALKCLMRRDYAIAELRRKLLLKDTVFVDQIIARLIKENLLQDSRFAESYVRMRQQRGYGKVRIRQELREKGLDDDTIAASLSQQEWLMVAKQVRLKKFGRKIPSSVKEKAQQIRFLYYRGFSSAEINQVMQHDDEC